MKQDDRKKDKQDPKPLEPQGPPIKPTDPQPPPADPNDGDPIGPGK